MADAAVVRAGEYRREELDGGTLFWFTSREQGNSETLTTGMCTLLSGAANPRHYHPNCDEVLYVLEGQILHSFGDEETELKPGDVISITAGTIHNARNIGVGDARLMICFSSADRQTVIV